MVRYRGGITGLPIDILRKRDSSAALKRVAGCSLVFIGTGCQFSTGRMKSKGYVEICIN